MTAIRLVIITVPPAEICRLIDRTRRRLSRLTGSRAGLNYPPHVTLRTGALVPEGGMRGFVRELGGTLGEWHAFPIRTEGPWMEPYLADGQTRYFVGYRVRKDDALAALNRRLLAYTPFRRSERTEFNPHLTLLFDDLDRQGFHEAQRYLRLHPELALEGLEWSCDNVGLYAFRGGRWRPLHVYRPMPEEGGGAPPAKEENRKVRRFGRR